MASERPLRTAELRSGSAPRYMRRGLSIVVEEVAFNAAFLGGISIFLPPGTMAVLPPLPARERGL